MESKGNVETAMENALGRRSTGRLRGRLFGRTHLLPDFIIIGGAEGDVRPWFVGDRELLEDPSFAEHYRLREAPIPMGRGRPPFAFRYFERDE